MNGNGWKTAAIAGLWGLVLLFGGWAFNDGQSAKQEAKDEIRILRQQHADHTTRIATLEEAIRNIRQSTERIEDGINDLRRRRQ